MSTENKYTPNHHGTSKVRENKKTKSNYHPEVWVSVHALRELGVEPGDRIEWDVIDGRLVGEVQD